MEDVCDVAARNSMFVDDPHIAGDARRNIAVGICIDGVSPFQRNSLSLWPVSVVCFNLSSWQRDKITATHPCFVVCLSKGQKGSGVAPILTV